LDFGSLGFGGYAEGVEFGLLFAFERFQGVFDQFALYLFYAWYHSLGPAGEACARACRYAAAEIGLQQRGVSARGRSSFWWWRATTAPSGAKTWRVSGSKLPTLTSCGCPT
jgi:hypothetical protein